MEGGEPENGVEMWGGVGNLGVGRLWSKLKWERAGSLASRVGSLGRLGHDGDVVLGTGKRGTALANVYHVIWGVMCPACLFA